MLETLYLIAHKVRGQPAFDIAIQMPMDDEIWWIIPTSGHRAYPYWNIALNDLRYEDGIGYTEMWCRINPDMPSPWPDHYWQPGQTSDLDIPETPEGTGLLQALGLRKPVEPLRRRV